MAGRYPKQNWQSGTVLAPYGPLSGARLQKIDDAMAVIYDDFDLHVGAPNPHTQYLLAPANPVANGAVWYNGSLYVVGKLTKDQIDPAAGVLKSQLAPLGIVDADVNSISAAKITGLPTPPAQVIIPAGLMADFGGDVAPSGWVLCDGATYDGTNPTYTALWNAIQTKHGGTGQSAFMVPDCRGRVVVSKGTHADVDTVGKNDGTVLALRRPKHSHPHGLSFTGTPSTTGTDSPDHTHTYSPTGGAQPSAGGANSAVAAGGPTQTGGASARHAHSFTPAGTISGVIGAAGMTDSEAYVVCTKIIKL